jgi:hypothetical protein
MTTTTTENITKTTEDPSYIPRGSTTSSLTFYAPPPDNSAPYNYVEPQPPGQLQRNYGENEQNVTISDIRGAENTFNLEKDAFQALQHVSTSTSYETFDSETLIRETYYPEVESLLLSKIPGAHKIVLFDHTIRRQKDGAPRAPVTRVHVDQTRRAASDRVKLHITDSEEAERLLAGRYRIVNVWRPITEEPVQSAPLAFAAASSVQPEDLVPVQHRYPNRVGETLGVKFNEGQRWYYWSGMTSDERLLLKCSDSEVVSNPDAGIGESVPHTAFWDGRTPVGARGRESIEVRALVFG